MGFFSLSVCKHQAWTIAVQEAGTFVYLGCRKKTDAHANIHTTFKVLQPITTILIYCKKYLYTILFSWYSLIYILRQIKLTWNKAISMMRGKSLPPEIILRKNQDKQLFYFFKENLEREIISCFVKISFCRIHSHIFC